MHKIPLFHEKIWQNTLVLVGIQPFSEVICSNNPLESFLERSNAWFVFIKGYNLTEEWIFEKLWGFLQKFCENFWNKGIMQIREKFPYLTHFRKLLWFPYLDQPLYVIWTYI